MLRRFSSIVHSIRMSSQSPFCFSRGMGNSSIVLDGQENGVSGKGVRLERIGYGFVVRNVG